MPNQVFRNLVGAAKKNMNNDADDNADDNADDDDVPPSCDSL
jgi:hypothetical protein